MTKVKTIVAIFSLIYTDFQVSIAKADLEARTTPYLSIESIQVEDGGED